MQCRMQKAMGLYSDGLCYHTILIAADAHNFSRIVVTPSKVTPVVR